MKATGGRRYYRPDDVEVLKLIQTLLYQKRYTIEGAQQLIKEKGLKNLLGSDEIQKDFFEASPRQEENAPETPKRQVSTAALNGIALAIDELKVLRNKLSDL